MPRKAKRKSRYDYARCPKHPDCGASIPGCKECDIAAAEFDRALARRPRPKWLIDDLNGVDESHA